MARVHNIPTLGLRLTAGGMIFGGLLLVTVAVWIWPTSIEMWGFALIAPLIGLAGAANASAGFKQAWKVYLLERKIWEFFTHGDGRKSARWATYEDLKSAGMIGYNGGRAIGVWPATGEIICEPRSAYGVSGMLAAAAGQWKSSAGVRTWAVTLLRDKDARIINMDGKDGENCLILARAMYDRGRNVGIVDDCNELGDHPLKVRINVFGDVKKAYAEGAPNRFFMVQELMLVALPEPTAGAGDQDKNKYFRKEPRRYAGFILAYLARYHPELCTPGGVWTVLGDPEKFLDCVERAIDEAGDDGELAMRSEALWIKEQFNKNEDLAAQHMSEAVDMFSSYVAGGLLHDSGFEAELTHQDALDQGMDLFIVGPAADSKLLSVHYGMHQQCIVRCQQSKKGQIRTHMILEEMTATPCGQILEDIVKFRGAGLRLLMCFQSMSEVRRKYGEELSLTLEDNTYVRQYFGLNFEDCKRLSELIGDTYYVSQTGNFNDNSPDLGGSFSTTVERLATADELSRMPITQQLVYCKTDSSPVGWFVCDKLGAHQIADICYDLEASGFERDGGLKPDPKVKI